MLKSKSIAGTRQRSETDFYCNNDKSPATTKEEGVDCFLAGCQRKMANEMYDNRFMGACNVTHTNYFHSSAPPERQDANLFLPVLHVCITFSREHFPTEFKWHKTCTHAIKTDTNREKKTFNYM